MRRHLEYMKPKGLESWTSLKRDLRMGSARELGAKERASRRIRPFVLDFRGRSYAMKFDISRVSDCDKVTGTSIYDLESECSMPKSFSE